MKYAVRELVCKIVVENRVTLLWSTRAKKIKYSRSRHDKGRARAGRTVSQRVETRPVRDKNPLKWWSVRFRHRTHVAQAWRVSVTWGTSKDSKHEGGPVAEEERAKNIENLQFNYIKGELL